MEHLTTEVLLLRHLHGVQCLDIRLHQDTTTIVGIMDKGIQAIHPDMTIRPIMTIRLTMASHRSIGAPMDNQRRLPLHLEHTQPQLMEHQEHRLPVIQLPQERTLQLLLLNTLVAMITVVGMVLELVINLQTSREARRKEEAQDLFRIILTVVE